MDRIRIRGGVPLNGLIPISGAKNAALPLMIASLLTEETLELSNVPRLADISSLLRILSNLGADHMIAGRRPGERPRVAGRKPRTSIIPTGRGGHQPVRKTCGSGGL